MGTATRRVWPLDAVAYRGPAEHGAHGAGECADEGGHGGDALERRIDGHIGEDGEQCQRDGEQIGAQRQPDSAEGDSAEAGDDADGERPAARCEGTIGSALHARVGGAFESLIKSPSAGGDEADAEQRIEQAGLQGRDAGPHRSQIKAAPTGDEDQTDHFDLEELAQVVDERGRDAGRGGMNGVRRGIDGEVRWRSGLGGGSHGNEIEVRRRERGRGGLCFDDSKWGGEPYEPGFGLDGSFAR